MNIVTRTIAIATVTLGLIAGGSVAAQAAPATRSHTSVVTVSETSFLVKLLNKGHHTRVAFVELTTDGTYLVFRGRSAAGRPIGAWATIDHRQMAIITASDDLRINSH